MKPKLRLFQLRNAVTKEVLPASYPDKAAAQRSRNSSEVAKLNAVFEVVPGPDHRRYVAPEQRA